MATGMNMDQIMTNVNKGGPKKILYCYPILIDVFLFILIVVVPKD